MLLLTHVILTTVEPAALLNCCFVRWWLRMRARGYRRRKRAVTEEESARGYSDAGSKAMVKHTVFQFSSNNGRKNCFTDEKDKT
jgi:hypothetical protein